MFHSADVYDAGPLRLVPRLLRSSLLRTCGTGTGSTGPGTHGWTSNRARVGSDDSPFLGRTWSRSRWHAGADCCSSADLSSRDALREFGEPIYELGPASEPGRATPASRSWLAALISDLLC